jgi:hypothetical protein
VPGLPVLVAGTIQEDADQLVIPDAALALGGPDAGVFHRTAESTGHRGVDDGSAMAAGAELRVGPRAGDSGRRGSPRQRRRDSLALGPALCGLGVPDVDAVARGRVQHAIDVEGGEKDYRHDEGHPYLGDGLLALQQGLEAFGLAVRKQERVVRGDRPALVAPRPGAHVALDHPGAALDLDKEEPGRAQHQEVDLVDAAVVRDELEVGPGSVGVSVRQALADKIERLLLPAEAGRCDRLPALGA